MIIIHNFNIDLRSYADKGKNNEFPIYDKCPSCHSWGNMQKHGFYWRFAVTDTLTEKIPIRRLKCNCCKKTFSILPDFLIPYFQHTLHTILDHIENKLNEKETSSLSHQLIRFYLVRFMSQLNWIYTFFSDIGEVFEVIEDSKEKAKKYLHKLRDFSESAFLRKSMGHLAKYLMAK